MEEKRWDNNREKRKEIDDKIEKFFGEIKMRFGISKKGCKMDKNRKEK